MQVGGNLYRHSSTLQMEDAMREHLRPGNSFPDFELPDTDNKVMRLSERMDGWPTVVTFNRGNY